MFPTVITVVLTCPWFHWHRMANRLLSWRTPRFQNINYLKYCPVFLPLQSYCTFNLHVPSHFRPILSAWNFGGNPTFFEFFIGQKCSLHFVAVYFKVQTMKCPVWCWALSKTQGRTEHLSVPHYKNIPNKYLIGDCIGVQFRTGILQLST